MTDATIQYFEDFVNVSQGADYYIKWITANNKLLAPRWFSFRDDILAGKRPTPPDMGNNKYGGGLVKAGVMYLGLTAQQPAPTPTPTPIPTPNTPLAARWWTVDSPWNTPASAFSVHSQSDAWMSFVKSKLTTPGYLWINAKAWTPVIYSVRVGRDAGWDYHDNYGWGRSWKLRGVPLSPNMIAPMDINNTVTDNPVYIFDEGTNIWYCVAFIPGKQPNGDWDAGGGGSLGAGHLNGSGFWDNGKKTPITAAGGGSLDVGGMVHLHELNAGRIPHALKCSLPNPAHRGPYDAFNGAPASRVMLPATRSDGGAGDNTSAPPYGCRYQLDPAFDVDAYSTDPHTRVFLRCLQEFGTIDTDSTGSNMFSLYGSSPKAPAFPFRPDSPFNGTSLLYDRGISGIVDHLRILTPPASVTLESPSTFDPTRWVNI